MLRITVDILPHERATWRQVARLSVDNSHEGDGKYEVYFVEGCAEGRSFHRASIGLVKRNATAPLALAARAIHALGYVVPEPPKDSDVGRCEARFREWLGTMAAPFTDLEIEAAVGEVFGKPAKEKKQ